MGSSFAGQVTVHGSGRFTSQVLLTQGPIVRRGGLDPLAARVPEYLGAQAKILHQLLFEVADPSLRACAEGTGNFLGTDVGDAESGVGNVLAGTAFVDIMRMMVELEAQMWKGHVEFRLQGYQLASGVDL